MTSIRAMETLLVELEPPVAALIFASLKFSVASIELERSVMANPGGPPRKINLNLPGDYFSTPTTKFVEWLEANTAALRPLSEDQIIQRARTTLGGDLSRLNDGDLAAQIREWAKSHQFVLPRSVGAARVHAGDPEAVDRLKKLFASISPEVKWVYPGGDAAINVSGFTATVSSGQTRSTLALGWNETLQFKTQTSGMTFAASVGPQNWSLTVTIGRTAPNIGDLESIFKKGETAVRGVLSNLDKVDLRDPGKTKNQFAPYLDPIKSAIDAASKTAAARPGDVSFGAWAQGGVPGTGGVGGVSAGVGLTILF
jgi:hypothetical protein